MKNSCQIYVKGSIEAVAFYQKAFNLSLGMTALHEDGTYEHVSLMDGDYEFLALAEDSHDICSDEVIDNKCPVMAFNAYNLSTKEMVDQAYAVLSVGARFNENPDGPTPPFWDANGYGFSLVDKFGVHWGVLK